MCMSAQKRLSSGKGSHTRKSAQISDWSDIHFAFQVARLGTLSAAAEALEVHHSTVLRRIDALEQRLNVRLFHRHARGYTATEAGKLLLQVASQTQEEFDRLMGQLAGVGEELSGNIVVTTVNSFSPKLTPILAEFQRRNPEIRIELVVDSRIFKLEYGEAHVSIRPGNQPKEPDYIVQQLRTMGTTFYASQGYINQYGRMKDRNDIKGHRFISSILPYSNIRHMRWMREHIPDDQIYYRASDFVSMMHAAEADLGIAPVECWLAETSNNMEAMFAPPKDWDSDLWLVTHRDIHRTPKVQAITQFLKEQFKNR